MLETHLFGVAAMISQPTRDILRAVLILVSAATLGACSNGPTRPAGPEPSRVPAADTTKSTTAAIGERAVWVALQQVGVPYRYGGQTPTGFDCSGLVHYAYHRVGKSVPRTTAQLWTNVTPVNRNELQLGDLVFFSIEGKMQHVGMYIGDGRFVHAPATGKTVNVQSLSSDYYQRAFLRAGRPH